MPGLSTTTSLRRLCLLALAAPGLALAQQAPQPPQQPQEAAAPPRWQPQGPAVELNTGLTRTDNVFQDDANKQSDTVASAGFSVDVAQHRERFDATALGSVGWYDYLDNSFGSRAFGNFNGSARYAIVPERFVWQAQESFGQLVSDPLLSRTANNLENVNYLTTGPVFTQRFGGTNALQVQGAYSKTSYERANADNDQLSGGIGLIHDISPQSNVSLNANYSDVRFDSGSGSADYKTKSVYAGMRAQGFRTQLDARLGYTELEPENQSSTGGALVQLNGSRRISPASSVFLRLRRQFSTAADTLRDQVNAANPGNPQTGIATGEAYQETGGSVGWAYQQSRTTMGVAYDRSKQEYETAAGFDRHISRIDVYFSRRLRPTLSWNLTASQERSDYDTRGFKDDQLNFGTSLSWQAGRTIYFDVRYDRLRRTTSGDPALTSLAGEYSENRYGVRLFYRPLRTR